MNELNNQAMEAAEKAMENVPEGSGVLGYAVAFGAGVVTTLAGLGIKKLVTNRKHKKAEPEPEAPKDEEKKDVEKVSGEVVKEDDKEA